MASDFSDEKGTKSAGMSRNYLCIDCKCTTRNPRLYLEHRRDFHNEPVSIHACDLCVYASKHSQKLARHMRTVHRDAIQSTNESIEISNQPNELIPDGFQAIKTGKNTRLATCKLCGLYTVSKTCLIEHVRSQHTEVTIYECDQCEYSHYIRDRYNRHHRYHSMNQIQCKMCEFQTIYRWNLERHMKHHIDHISLGFRCSKCNFTASTKQSITAHEISHHSGLLLHNNLNIKTETLQAKEEPNDSAEQMLQIKQEPIEENDNENDREHGNDMKNHDDEHDDENYKKNDEENDENYEKNDNNAENSIKNENAVEQFEEGGNDFDASAFLEIVMDNEAQLNTDCQFKDITVKQEESMENPESQKMQYFHCVNCNFR